ncbi:MAG: hypothetical protein ACO3LD_01960 [Luminiphilus sp.]|jgi:hypothetical protein
MELNDLPATQGAVIRDLNHMFSATAAQNMRRFKIENAIGFFVASDALHAVSALGALDIRRQVRGFARC